MSKKKQSYKIKSIHEETLSDGEIIAIFLNEKDDKTFKESIISIFDETTKIYLVFNSLLDLFQYKYYGVRVMQRAYISEEEFDNYLDNGSEKPLSEILEFTK